MEERMSEIDQESVQSTPGAAAQAYNASTSLTVAEERRAESRAATVAQAQAKEAALSPAQRRIAELNRPDSPIWDDKHQDHAKARDELRRLLAGEMTADEKQATADAPLGQLREQYGLNHHEAVLPVLRERWDSEEEATLLATFSQQGLAPEAVSAFYSWYSDMFNGALGDVRNLDVDKIIGEFRALAKQHNVTEDVVNALIEHHVGRLRR
jgi:hypothetical protein